MSDRLVSHRIENGVGIVSLDSPGNLNAMSTRMVDHLNDALDACEGEVRAILLRAEGRAFSSGADLSQRMGGNDPTIVDIGSSLETHGNPLMLRLINLPIPWIAAVRGAAAGFGCALAFAADIVVASETAYFMQSFSKVGLIPDGGAFYLTSRSAGRIRAMEMALLGDRLPADKALDWGLVTRVVPDDALERESLALAERIGAGPASLALTRKAAWAAMDETLPASLAFERALQRQAGQTDDFGEGVAAFLEKRAPRFTGH